MFKLFFATFSWYRESWNLQFEDFNRWSIDGFCRKFSPPPASKHPNENRVVLRSVSSITVHWSPDLKCYNDSLTIKNQSRNRRVERGPEGTSVAWHESYNICNFSFAIETATKWFTLMKHKTLSELLMMSISPVTSLNSCAAAGLIGFSSGYRCRGDNDIFPRFPTSNPLSTSRWHYNQSTLPSFDENNADLKNFERSSNLVSIRSSVRPGNFPWIFKLFDGVMKLLFHGCTHEYFKICIWCLLKSICFEYVHQISHSWSFRRILFRTMTEIFKFSDFFISSLLILQQIMSIKLEHCPVNIFFHKDG